ncbi:ATP-binding cassette domain-containing protein [Chelatococcus sambhunathii]|uniref:ATP-binding cassette domain-containing protein n=1 Tax=Chelatococcus sambhunathii TaxID=363953 RepID=A0ABU1DC96_9HYPH|nr:ATP-binding cassette domain-containing protein [Chelatococcus sambhunathii]MDR4305724.1 ATP-binding cassette domain-containing protein [Chelatococcus sambhunathii]
MAKIVLNDVSKIHRGGVEALRDVSLDLPDGAITAVTGPAGAGKTTLLRLIAAQDAPTAGTVEVGDAVSQSWRLGRSKVVEFAERGALKGSRNVYDTMAAGLTERGLKRSEAEAAVLKAADAVELGPFMARRVSSLSDGERTRVILGRAFAHQPRAILLDDPFAGLDAVRRMALRRELRALKAAGATILLATHDWTDALALADHLVVLDRGHLVASGPARALYDRPPTAEAARLIGDPPMNVLPVRANQTGLSLEDGTHFGATSVMTTATFALLGVRPEALFAVDDERAPHAAATFPVRVEEIERGANVNLVHGFVGSHAFVGRVAGHVEAPASGLLKLGAAREALVLFDAETGAAA